MNYLETLTKSIKNERKNASIVRYVLGLLEEQEKDTGGWAFFHRVINSDPTQLLNKTVEGVNYTITVAPNKMNVFVDGNLITDHSSAMYESPVFSSFNQKLCFIETLSRSLKGDNNHQFSHHINLDELDLNIGCIEDYPSHSVTPPTDTLKGLEYGYAKDIVMALLSVRVVGEPHGEVCVNPDWYNKLSEDWEEEFGISIPEMMSSAIDISKHMHIGGEGTTTTLP